MFFVKCPKADEASRLHKEATVLLRAKDVDGAIARLREARAYMMFSEVSFGVDAWHRLPRELQRAGRFAEAMREMDFLLGDLERRLKREFRFDDDNVHFADPKDVLFAQAYPVSRRILWRWRRRLQIREIKRLRKLAKST